MRRTLIACRAGLAAGAAFVLLTACGGGSDADNDAASSSSTETKTAFSEEASDPTSVAQQLQQVASAMRALDPPAEISDDWETLASGLDQLAAAFAQFNPNDPASASSFAQQSQQLQTELTAAGASVEQYLTQECGIDTGETTEGATPTS